MPGVDKPLTNSNTKKFGVLFWKSKPLVATLKIPRNGFTPGEAIPISGDVKNLSNKRIKSTKTRLYQDITFYASEGKTRTMSRILQEVKNGPIEANSTDSWEGIPLTIPSVPPTGLGGCRIIEVTYRLILIVSPRGFGYDLSVSLPIEIGNIPLTSSLV